LKYYYFISTSIF